MLLPTWNFSLGRVSDVQSLLASPPLLKLSYASPFATVLAKCPVFKMGQKRPMWNLVDLEEVSIKIIAATAWLSPEV